MIIEIHGEGDLEEVDESMMLQTSKILPVV
jgi:hypothetical protein